MQIVNAIRVSLVTIILTGMIYPFAVTGIGQLMFPHNSRGSLIYDKNNNILGSELIGQKFRNLAYFSSRPSMAGEKKYEADKSGASNLSYGSPLLLAELVKRQAGLQEHSAMLHIPADLLFASASGLDPHISEAAAIAQAGRIAQIRGISLERVKNLIKAQIEPREFFILGEEKVNVVLLNQALDRQFGKSISYNSE